MIGRRDHRKCISQHSAAWRISCTYTWDNRANVTRTEAQVETLVGNIFNLVDSRQSSLVLGLGIVHFTLSVNTYGRAKA